MISIQKRVDRIKTINQIGYKTETRAITVDFGRQPLYASVLSNLTEKL